MEHPSTLNSYAHRAFLERVSFYTVTIVNTVQEQVTPTISQDLIGTCAAIRWAGRPLLITARHNLDGCGPNDLRFMLRVGTTLEKSSPDSDPVPEVTTCQPLPVTRITLCDFDDLAIIELHSDYFSPSLQFYSNLRSDSKTPPADTDVLLLGSPAQTGSVVHESRDSGGKLWKAMKFSTMAITPTIREQEESFRFLKGFDPEQQFLAELAAAEDLDPRGFSGCGVWNYVDPGRAEVWEPRAELVGIETHYYSNRKLLKCVRVETLRKFVSETYGD